MKWDKVFLCMGAALALSSCGFGGGKVKASKLYKEDLAAGRVVDVTKIKKLTGTSSLLIFKKPKYGDMLEGYIRGIITDYDSRPVEGVIVRAVLTQAQETKKKKKGQPSEEVLELQTELENSKKEEAGEGPNFDPGITDADGIYRIRFSFPIIESKVDIKGKLLYNPGWAQQHDTLGQSYEPQMKESDFRLYYSEKDKYLIFSEGVRSAIVRPVRAEGKASPITLKGSPKPETVTAPSKEPQQQRPTGRQPARQEQPKQQEESGGDDFFKGFNFEP